MMTYNFKIKRDGEYVEEINIIAKDDDNAYRILEKAGYNLAGETIVFTGTH